MFGKIRRLTALLLAVLMLISMLPADVLAEGKVNSPFIPAVGPGTRIKESTMPLAAAQPVITGPEAIEINSPEAVFEIQGGNAGDYLWFSTNTSVLSFDAANPGHATAHSIGDARVKVMLKTNPGITATKYVTVRDQETELYIEAPAQVRVGGQVQIQVYSNKKVDNVRVDIGANLGKFCQTSGSAGQKFSVTVNLDAQGSDGRWTSSTPITVWAGNVSSKDSFAAYLEDGSEAYAVHIIEILPSDDYGTVRAIAVAFNAPNTPATIVKDEWTISIAPTYKVTIPSTKDNSSEPAAKFAEPYIECGGTTYAFTGIVYAAGMDKNKATILSRSDDSSSAKAGRVYYVPEDKTADMTGVHYTDLTDINNGTNIPNDCGLIYRYEPVSTEEETTDATGEIEDISLSLSEKHYTKPGAGKQAFYISVYLDNPSDKSTGCPSIQKGDPGTTFLGTLGPYYFRTGTQFEVHVDFANSEYAFCHLWTRTGGNDAGDGPIENNHNALHVENGSESVTSQMEMNNYAGEGKTREIEYHVYRRTYQLHYDLDGGQNQSNFPDETHHYNDNVTVKSGEPSKNGFIFGGWERQNSGLIYEPGDSFNMPKANVTLKAIWISKNQAIYYEAVPPEGGSVSLDMEAIIQEDVATQTGATLKGSIAEPKLGWLFDGWYKDEACTEPVADKNTYQFVPKNQTTPATYYAHFVENELAKTTVNVTKVWEDANNQDGKRTEATVTLFKNGTSTGQTLTFDGSSQTQMGSFSGLKTYENGAEVTYTVQETGVPAGYTPTLDIQQGDIGANGERTVTATITNSYTPATTSVTVKKVWEDADNVNNDRPTSWQVQLKQNDSDYGEAVTVAGDSYTWPGLPEYQGGAPVTYTVDEVNVPTGYTATVSGSAPSFTITNHKDVSKVVLSKKATVSGSSPAKVGDVITYTLTVENKGNVALSNYTITDTLTGIVVTEQSGVTYDATAGTFTIANLAAGATVTITYTYTVQESDLGTNGNGAVTNTATGDHGGETTTTTDVEEKNESFTVEKTATVDGANVNGGTVNVGQTITYTITVTNTGNVELKNQKLTDTFTGGAGNLTWTSADPTVTPFDVPVGKSATFTATYMVQEADATNKLSNVAALGSQTSETITTVNPSTIDVSGTKTWIDGEKEHNNETEVQLTLKRKTEGGSEETVSGFKPTWSGNSYTFKAVPKSDENGKLYTYTVEETQVDGYSEPVYDATHLNITNTIAQDQITISGEKVWVAPEGETHPNITIQLQRDAEDMPGKTVTLKNGRTEFSFSDLDKYDLSTGREYAYSVTEVAPDGYTSKVTTGANGSFTVTNTKDSGTATQPVKTATVNGEAYVDGMVHVGDEITYTISYYNHTNAEQTITITDTLDEGLDVDALNGGSYDPSTRTVTWTISNVAPFTGGTVSLTVKVNAQAIANADSSVANTANVKVGNVSDQKSNPVTIPVEKADWTVVKMVAIGKASGNTQTNKAEVGDTLTYTVTVTNTGNVEITKEVTDTFKVDGADAALTSELALDPTKSGEGVKFEGGKVTIPANQTATFTASYTIAADDKVISNVATVGGKRSDTVTTTVEDAPAWTVVKVADKERANAGDTITYTITVKNTGNVAITKAVTDALTVDGKPAMLTNELTLDRMNSDAGVTYNGGNVTIPVGQTAVFTATYKVEDDDRKIENVATVGNVSSDTVTTTVADNPKYEASKAVSGTIAGGENAGKVKVGDKLTYTITVKNTGNTVLNDLAVSDQLNGENVDLSKATLSGSTSAKLVKQEDGTYILNGLAVGETVTLTYDYTVQKDDVELSNTAVVGDDKDNTTDTEVVPTPAYEASKAVSGMIAEGENAGKVEVGQTLTYTITVKNTGNTVLNDLAVSDQLNGENVDLSKATLTSETLGSGTTASFDGTTLSGLAVGETVTLTYSYEVQATDAKLANTASVGDDSDNTTTTDVVPKPGIQVEKEVVEPKQAYALGEVIRYRLTVKNSGNVALTDVRVVDAMLQAASDASVTPATGYSIGKDGALVIGKIEPDGEFVITYSHQVTPADIQAGKVVNTATATGTVESDPNTPVTDSKTVTVETEAPQSGLTAEKTLTNQGTSEEADANGKKFQAGDTATFDIVVTNSGNTVQESVTVTELLPGAKFKSASEATYSYAGNLSPQPDEATVTIGADGREATITNLAPGASVTLKAEYTVTQADIDSDAELKNIATVQGDNGTDPDPQPEVEIPEEEQRHKLGIEKKLTNQGTSDEVDANDNRKFRAGDAANFEIVVTNLGNTTQTNVAVTDALSNDKTVIIGGVTAKNAAGEAKSVSYTRGDAGVTIEEMLPGDVVTIHAAYIVEQADIESSAVLKNTATVASDEYPSGVSSTVDIPTEGVKASLHVDKLLKNPKAAYREGDTIEFTIVVYNDGDVDLTDVDLTDAMANGFVAGTQRPTNLTIGGDGKTLTIGDLPVGGSASVDARYTLTAEDMANETYTNLAKAEGKYDDQPVESSATREAPLSRNPALTVEKAATGAMPEGGYDLGAEIPYRIVVTNSGDVTLEDIAVQDEKTGLDAAIDSLAPGESKEFETTYTVTEDDLGKPLANTATAKGNTVYNAEVSGEDTETVDTAAILRDFEIDKRIDSETSVGGRVVFSIQIENTGNVTLDDIRVTDAQMTADTDPMLNAVAPATGAFHAEGGYFEIDGLLPNRTVEITYGRTITQDEMDAGLITNTATARTAEGLEKSDTARRSLQQHKNLSATKTLTNQGTSDEVDADSGEAKFQAGDTATFDIVVTNGGNTVQRNVLVREQLAGAKFVQEGQDSAKYTVSEDGGTATIPVLNPDESVTLKAEYIVTQEDIDSDAVLKNVVTVRGDNGTNPDPQPEEQIPTEEQSPGLTVYKQVSPQNSVGGRVEFQIIVENAGNVTLTNIDVHDEQFGELAIEWISSDPKAHWDSSAKRIDQLAPGKRMVLTYSRTITQDEMDAGVITNTARAEASYKGEPVEDEDTASRDLTRRPHLSIAKSTTSAPANGTGYALGETITYEIVATNDGNVSLDFELEDELTGDTWPVEKLAPDETVTVTASHVVTEADILAGKVANVATAEPRISGEDPEGDPTPVPVVPGETEDGTEPKRGHLSIHKEATSQPANGAAYVAGEEITYAITATNDGNLTLTDVTVTDELTGEHWTIATLVPGSSETFTAHYVVRPEDAAAGYVHNVATAAGTSPDPDEPETPVDPGEDDEKAEPQRPALTVDKSAAAGPYGLGDTIRYTIVVRNSGNVALANVTVTDPLTGLNQAIGALAIGESRQFATAHTVTEVDLRNGSVYNAAYASGSAPDGSPANGSDSESSRTVAKDSHLSIRKRVTSAPANGASYVLGETITYEIVATNDGNQTLTNVRVTDELTGDAWTIASLAPGASESFAAEHAVTEADVLAGSVVNVATATGTSPDPENPDVPVDPGETETPTEEKRGHVTIAKRVTSAPANGTGYALGETITYEITATNDGNLTVTDVRVTDELTGDAWTIASLAPGASESFAAEYAVTQADLDAGSVVNVATATGTSPDPENPDVPVDPGETETPTVEKAPALTVEKRAPAGPYGAGDVIQYSIEVRNSGNVTLTNVVVTDPLTGLNETIERLAPGESRSIETSYAVTEADAAAGSVRNVATATGSDPDGEAVTAEGEVRVEALERVTLTVRYWYGAVGGATAAPTFRRSYFAGSRYNVASPAIAGYARSVARVRGTIRQDTVLDVIYTALNYTLTVNYVYEDGSTAAPTNVQTLRAGAAYSIASPAIAGYTASQAVIAGEMPGRDVTYTVIYVPNEMDILIDEYGVPLNLGNVTLNVGECFE